MRILFLSVEVAPLWKVGGLADVAAGLPGALRAAGHDVRVATPFHRGVGTADALLDETAPGPVLDVPGPGPTAEARLRQARLPGSDVSLLLVDAPALFDRGAVYTASEDEAERFAFFTRAALSACAVIDWMPDVVHANDWHTALAPLLLDTLRDVPQLARASTVLTLHNVGYRGDVAARDLAGLGVVEGTLRPREIVGGETSFLRLGVGHADALTTVSPAYAREVLEPAMGMGLQDALRERAGDLFGIVNGVDTSVWSPAVDPHIPARYTAEDLSGKAVCRGELLAETGLAPDPTGPVVGMITRLVWQKGIELLPDVLPALLEESDARLVVLGAGDPGCERFLARLAAEEPRRVAYLPGEREPLAHRIEAGSDLFLMPSRYEPCGLNQQYSQIYGTLPLVHATGGLVDTVEDAGARGGRGTGFVFEPFGVAPCLDALRRALALFADREGWLRVVRRAMARDFGWGASAAEYVRVYDRVTSRSRTAARSRPST